MLRSIARIIQVFLNAYQDQSDCDADVRKAPDFEEKALVAQLIFDEAKRFQHSGESRTDKEQKNQMAADTTGHFHYIFDQYKKWGITNNMKNVSVKNETDVNVDAEIENETKKSVKMD